MDLNVIAIIVGGFIYMAFGAFYYSPVLFGNKWGQLNNVGEEGTKPINFVWSAVVAFASSFFMAVIVDLAGATDLAAGLQVGALVGILLLLGFFKNMVFGMTSKKVYAIAVSDHFIMFCVLGMLHAIWG
ncbi:DUF1761 domain-containing protein [Pseudalkalibacillus berkeleyi]|uniref:DUF1761 domain-containing protein n=1 Tax=Pseudalkalibacillus berkeleyi TaxID=1069813 RepID=A0ABS9H2D0_9BACL|nr:DUF1761 domain-containing protein [Pseudalkalibacillus berkeleyi]MCF6139044.1 DUF1761 domain-containing protein [Pseudalkalibacillus berkeleyi]